jgi:hypothetical protein
MENTRQLGDEIQAGATRIKRGTGFILVVGVAFGAESGSLLNSVSRRICCIHHTMINKRCHELLTLATGIGGLAWMVGSKLAMRLGLLNAVDKLTSEIRSK